MEICGIQVRPFFFFVLLASTLMLTLLYIYSGNFRVSTYYTNEDDHIKLNRSYTNISSIDVIQIRKFIGMPVSPTMENNTMEVIREPVLTMFTTFKNDPSRHVIHSNVLKNWAQFLPLIRVILFTTNTDEKLTSLATNLGWLIIKAPAVNSHGTPYFKEMYEEARKRVSSTFYGYANGDLLFDKGLVESLEAVADCLGNFQKTLIIGRRTNYAINNQVLYKPKDIAIKAKQGKLFRADAEDYFMIAHNEFPWKKVPKLVIGRPAYDNFLVATAIKNGVSVVDATETLLTLHQTGRDGDFAGFKNKDANFNSKLIGPFNYGAGLTISAQFQTAFGPEKTVEVWSRTRKHLKQKILKCKKKTNPPPVTTTVPTTTSQTFTSSKNNTSV